MAERGKRTPDAVKRRIRELAADGWGATDIERKLTTDPEWSASTPSTRTIRSILATVPTANRMPWRMMDADPEDLPLILPVLAVAIERRFYGPEHALSTTEAELVVRMRRAAPELSARHVMEWVRSFTSGADSITDLQTYLAFAPWRSDRNLERFLAVVLRTSAFPEGDAVAWTDLARHATEDEE